MGRRRHGGVRGTGYGGVQGRVMQGMGALRMIGGCRARCMGYISRGIGRGAFDDVVVCCRKYSKEQATMTSTKACHAF